MKLLRFGPPGQEQPGMLDAQGRIRSLAGIVPDLTCDVLAPPGLAQLRALDPLHLPSPCTNPARLTFDVATRSLLPTNTCSRRWESSIASTRKQLLLIAEVAPSGSCPSPCCALSWTSEGPRMFALRGWGGLPNAAAPCSRASRIAPAPSDASDASVGTEGPAVPASRAPCRFKDARRPLRAFAGNAQGQA